MAPYRDDVESWKARALAAEQRLGELTARKPAPPWLLPVRLLCLSSAGLLYLMGCALAYGDPGKAVATYDHPLAGVFCALMYVIAEALILWCRRLDGQK